MGAIEEGSKVASGVIDNLKSQPLALALIVINVLFLGVMVYISTNAKEQAQRRDQLMIELAKDCMGSSLKKGDAQ